MSIKMKSEKTCFSSGNCHVYFVHSVIFLYNIRVGQKTLNITVTYGTGRTIAITWTNWFAKCYNSNFGKHPGCGETFVSSKLNRGSIYTVHRGSILHQTDRLDSVFNFIFNIWTQNNLWWIELQLQNFIDAIASNIFLIQENERNYFAKMSMLI